MNSRIKLQELKDLTEKINIIEERRLLKNNDKFILDYNVDGLLITDKNLCIEFCNPALLSLINYDLTDLVGSYITKLMSEKDKKKHIYKEIIAKIEENRKANNICKGESYKICDDISTTIVDFSGKEINVIISVGEIITNGIQQFICIIRKK